MIFQPHITVATIVEHQQRFLFVREQTTAGMVINQPAGHLEANETLEQAAIRETLEETAWQVELRGIVGIYLYRANNGVTYQRVCFAAKPILKLEQKLDPDITEATWLSYDEIHSAQQQCRSPLVLRCLQDYLHASLHPISVLKGIY